MLSVKNLADAGKDKRDQEAALALARSAVRIIVARRKKVVDFDMKRDPPDEETLLAHMLGPTGNLRAPTIRQGNILYIGFSEEAYQRLLE